MAVAAHRSVPALETHVVNRHRCETPGSIPSCGPRSSHRSAFHSIRAMKITPSVLVTGSCGLIGSEVSRFFARQGFQVHGIDSNHRAIFFGPEGDTSWMLGRLGREIPGYQHLALD